MSENVIFLKKKYLDVIRLYQNYNKNYYDKNKSIVSDQEFDTLKKNIIDLENQYEFLRSKYSPSKSVGFKPSKNFQKAKHRVPML